MKTAGLYYMKSIFVWGLIALALSACGKKGDDNNVPNGCSLGSSYQTNSVCYDGFGNPISMANQIGLGYISTNFPTSYNPSTMTISNGNAYMNFLREALGVCDRSKTNGGIYSCMSWLSGYAQLVIQAPQSINSNVASLTFFAYPRTNDNYWYGYQLPSLTNFIKGIIGFPVISNVGAYRNPLSINLTVSNVNQDRGFEGRAYGSYDTRANIGLIQLSVATGKLGENTFRYRLFYKGQEVGNGVLNRCINANCQ